MSVTSDVALLLRKQEYEELKNIVNNLYTDIYEIEMFNRAHLAIVKNTNFIVAYWAYIKWDEATNEMVETVNKYVKYCKDNNIPFRYIQIGEFETSDQYCYGNNPDDISIIMNTIYPYTSIKFSTKLDNFQEEL